MIKARIMNTFHTKPTPEVVQAKRERYFRRQSLFRIRFREEVQALVDMIRDQQLDQRLCFEPKHLD